MTTNWRRYSYARVLITATAFVKGKKITKEKSLIVPVIRVHYIQINVDILPKDAFEKIHSILSTLQDVVQVAHSTPMYTKTVYQDVIVWTIYTFDRLVMMDLIPKDTDRDGIITVIARISS